MNLIIRAALQPLINAVVAAIKIVRCYQGPGLIYQAKADGTLVTTCDTKSEKAAVDVLMSYPELENFGLAVEEQGCIRAAADGSEYEIRFDGVDGTAPLSSGAITSTVIATIYSRSLGKTIACVVGEPASGRIWYATLGGGTFRFKLQPLNDGGFWLPSQTSHTRCQVYTGMISPKTITYADFYPGFSGNTFEFRVSDAVWGQLFRELFGNTSLHMMGSNGLHHALVANGGVGAIGAISTAIGGPWDVAPALLVTEAGGCAQAFRITDMGVLTRFDGLGSVDAQFVITATNQFNLSFLSGLLERCVFSQ